MTDEHDQASLDYAHPQGRFKGSRAQLLTTSGLVLLCVIAVAVSIALNSSRLVHRTNHSSATIALLVPHQGHMPSNVACWELRSQVPTYRESPSKFDPENTCTARHGTTSIMLSLDATGNTDVNVALSTYADNVSDFQSDSNLTGCNLASTTQGKTTILGAIQAYRCRLVARYGWSITFYSDGATIGIVTYKGKNPVRWATVERFLENLMLWLPGHGF